MSDKDKKTLVYRIAERFGVDPSKFFDTLKATAFKQRDGSAPTNEQMMALLVVSEQYNLNPFTKEIYAFPDKSNGIIPVVGVDGWSRIINEHPQFDGVEFIYSDKLVTPEGSKVQGYEWIEAVMYRKDRTHPIRIREYLDEVYRAPFQGKSRNGSYTVEGPWQTHTKRQHRHKAFVQCARIGFGFSGIYDQDEAERIREMEGGVVTPAVASVAVQPQPQAAPALDHKKVEPMLNKLVDRAIKQDAWGAALSYVQDRFKGEALEYATQYIQQAELDHKVPPMANENEVAPEPDPIQADDAEVIDHKADAPVSNGTEGFF